MRRRQPGAGVALIRASEAETAIGRRLLTVPSGPSGLLLEGEAGIGKTTVWMAGVADAAVGPYLVLSSRPAESEA